MKKLRSLWLGKLPLVEAFWTWAVSVGLLVNVTTSVLFLALITVDRPWAALLFGYALSVPYNLVAAVGVWRSAAHHEGPAGHAELARIVTLIVMLLLTLLVGFVLTWDDRRAAPIGEQPGRLRPVGRHQQRRSRRQRPRTACGRGRADCGYRRRP